MMMVKLTRNWVKPLSVAVEELMDGDVKILSSGEDADDEDEDEVNSRPYVIKYKNAVAELCRNGGYITGGSSRSFEGDFSEWLRLLVMESYENIKKDYLDNSKSRALKYEIITKYFKEYGWDIQAAGNKYRTEFDKYKASLPDGD